MSEHCDGPRIRPAFREGLGRLFGQGDTDAAAAACPLRDPVAYADRARMVLLKAGDDAADGGCGRGHYPADMTGE